MTARHDAIDALVGSYADTPWLRWRADDWARWAADHGVKVTDLRQVRLKSWSALSMASLDKRARIYALGEPPLPLEAGA